MVLPSKFFLFWGAVGFLMLVYITRGIIAPLVVVSICSAAIAAHKIDVRIDGVLYITLAASLAIQYFSTGVGFRTISMLGFSMMIGSVAAAVFVVVHSQKISKNGPIEEVAGDPEIEEEEIAQTQDHTLIGHDETSNEELYVADMSLNTHMLIAGTTGAGKTVSVMNFVQSYIERGLPVIYIDGKGDIGLANQIKKFGAAHGKEMKLFSMRGNSCNYNPLRSGGYSSKKDRVIELREWSEAHYRKLAEGYLQTVFKILEACKIEVNLINVADYLDRGKLLSLIRTHSQDLGDRAEILANEVQDMEEAEKQISSLKSEIRNLGRSEFGELLEGEENCLNIRDTIDKGGLAYFALSPLTFPALSDTLGKLIVNDLKASLDPQQPTKVLLVVDEFTTLAGPQVLNLLNQGRSMGLHAILTIQSIADLGQKVERNPDLFIEQVLANCNVYCVHRMNNANDADVLAGSIGTKKRLEITSQLSADGVTGMGSARNVREFLAHPDDIKTLGVGEAFYLDKPNKKFARVKIKQSAILKEEE